MEVLDENEWWNKIEQWKTGGEQEMLIKRNFSRGDQQTLSDMALQMGLYFHAYNKGKALVVSKVPLPDYRADLDERHGSTQKEVIEMLLVRKFCTQWWLLKRLYSFSCRLKCPQRLRENLEVF
jgi:hypothetical protein